MIRARFSNRPYRRVLFIGRSSCNRGSVSLRLLPEEGPRYALVPMGQERVTERQLRELAVLGRRFAEAAEPLLVEALERAAEALAVTNAERIDRLNKES